MAGLVKNLLASPTGGNFQASLGIGGGTASNSSNNGAFASDLERLIDLACNPTLIEPDMAMNLEICDQIKAKQKNAPREAALAILEHVHAKEQHESMLALNLLDCCVKNCDFGFHFQVASKDFLNELFKRFPERPPPVRTAVQEKILELIQQWHYLLYETSKYRADFVHINDMYRLLKQKGYHFPEIRTEMANVMRNDDSLKSKEELEAEDRKAQSAKLQELLRRATPADLQAANDLMKVMAGYYHDDGPRYEKKEAEELDRIEEKTTKLREIFDSLIPGTTNVVDNQTIQDLLSIVKTSQPKITKWIEDNAGESDSKGRLDRLLHMNDVMNEIMSRYETLKQRQLEPDAAGKRSEHSPGRKLKSKVETSLIDLDGDWEEPATSQSEPQSSGNTINDLSNDLLGLSFPTTNTSSAIGNEGRIQLPPSNPTLFGIAPVSHPQTSQSPANVTLSSLSRDNSPTKWQTGIALPNHSLIPSIFPESNAERILYTKNGLKITIKPHKSADGTIKAELFYSNSNSSMITQLSLQIAVPVACVLHMDACTSSVLPPNSLNSAFQTFTVKQTTLASICKIRFKISFNLNGFSMVDQGEFQF